MKNYGGVRSGPKTKESQGLHRAKKLSATIPWEMWLLVLEAKKENETVSGLIARLLNAGIKCKKL